MTCADLQAVTASLLHLLRVVVCSCMFQKNEFVTQTAKQHMCTVDCDCVLECGTGASPAEAVHKPATPPTPCGATDPPCLGREL